MTDHDQRLALKDAALAAAGRGWRVFPLRPGGTEPAVRDWRSRATTDPERIARAWGAGPYNVGIAVCASGLVVLDLVAAAPGERPPLPYRRLQGVVDGADVLALHVENEEARWPTETFTAAGPGGMHLYFAHPAGRPCPPATVGADGALGWHVAVRTAESFVPAVGSITRQGPFRLVHDVARLARQPPGRAAPPAGRLRHRPRTAPPRVRAHRIGPAEEEGPCTLALPPTRRGLAHTVVIAA